MSQSPGSPGQGVPRARIRHGRQGDRRLGRAPTPRHGSAEAPARHARGTPARGRGADIALGHGMAVPAPMVAEGARTAEHMPVDEPQGQLFGQRRDRAGVRTPEGRVLPRQGIRFVRLVQARAGRVHHVLEHQTTPGKTRGTHPGGVPEHVPRVLGMYPD